MNIAPLSAPPIHPLAAFATLALDGVLEPFEILTAPARFYLHQLLASWGFPATTMVQRYLAKDEWGASIAKGLVMGIVAGVPYPIAGTGGWRAAF